MEGIIAIMDPVMDPVMGEARGVGSGSALLGGIF